MSVRLAFVNHNGVQQTLAANDLDHGVVDVLETLSELVAQCFGALNHVLFLNKLKSPDRDSRAKWVTAIC